MISWTAVLAIGIVLVIAPLLPGITTKTKSWLTGRRGAPVLQLYFDLRKLWRKRSTYSWTTTWMFRLAPITVVVTGLGAVCLLPLDGRKSLLHFTGDLVAFAALFGLSRFALVLAGLDTGSSFEGMGASREATFSVFVEPALFLALLTLVLITGNLSLTGMLGEPLMSAWGHAASALALIAISLFLTLLAENARVPVDDPATHLELTMIHEVIVLDNSGPELGLILYGSALKFAVFSAFLVGLLVPRAAFSELLAVAMLVGGLALVAFAVGVVEGAMARLRLTRVPQFLVASSAFAALATFLVLWR